jgi:hypothetical protein
MPKPVGLAHGASASMVRSCAVSRSLAKPTSQQVGAVSVGCVAMLPRYVDGYGSWWNVAPNSLGS